MKNLSRFDIAMIIAFVVVGLLGGGSWYYISSQLQAAQDDVKSADDDFNKYSSQQAYLPTTGNVKILQSNIDLMKAQLDPLIKSRLQADGNKLGDVDNEDSVAWKHDLDEKVHALNAAAKIHGIDVPANFYFSFSRYLNQSPAEEKTGVLTKQLLCVENLATILINAPVKSIHGVRRTYDEDPPSDSTSNAGDVLGGHAIESGGHVYTAYPFELDFDTSIDGFRKVINDMVQSPYIIIIRSLTVENSSPNSPQLADLDKIAGSGAQPTGSILDSPGEAAAAKSSVGPQYLFGAESLHVDLKLDVIEWLGIASDKAPAKRSHKATSGANQ